MADYLRDRFPLAGTSTVYMDGTSGYDLVRFDRPGIIAPVRLSLEQAAAFRQAVQAARAEAWDEGYQASTDVELGHVAPADAVNPYREGEANRG